MALTEQEEFELLSLEREKAMASQQQPSQQTQQNVPSNIQPQNILGQIGNVPGAAIRSAIQGKGYAQGAMNPDQVPTFQSLQQNNPLAQLLSGGAPIGAAMDMATDPLSVLTMIGTGSAVRGVSSGMKALKGIMKWDDAAKQADMTKGALDALKESYSSMYDVMMNGVKDVPTNVDFGKQPLKVLKKITEVKDTYGVEFNANGSIKQTVGNMEKIKRAASEMITPKMRLEATNTEIGQIREFEGYLSSEMKRATEVAGKPIAKAMEEYGKFKDNYKLVNKAITEGGNTAYANKLKEFSRFTFEPVIKEASKILSKESPELKSIMGSRQNRELIKLLLKTSPSVPVVYESGKKMLTGSF